MSKFNSTTVGNNTVVNVAGGIAYLIKERKNELANYVLTSFFNEPKFYGDNSCAIVDCIKNVLDFDPKFVANLAVYTRKEMHLRSITHVLLSELAKHSEGKKFVRKALKEAVERVDDMTEILSYYMTKYSKPIPNSMKKGLSETFSKFDEYQLAKYNRQKEVKLKDILCLVHPKPSTKEQSEMWKRVLEDKLETPVTWETQISAKGNKGEVWDELIAEKKLGYMAALRNLRNILESGASNLNMVLEYIQNPNAIKNSKQLPTRYLAAYREIEALESYKTNSVLNALNDALEISVENLPKLPGKTFLIGDNSGSMDSKLSQNSKISYKDVGSLLMATSNKFCEVAITSVFGSEFKVVNTLQRDSVMTNINKFKTTNVGYATELWKAFDYLISNKIKVDRIIVFSDMQCYNSYGSKSANQIFAQYKKEVNPDVFLHSINLAGQDNTTQFIKGERVNLLSGWSEKVLEFISLVESGTDSLIGKISNYYFK